MIDEEWEARWQSAAPVDRRDVEVRGCKAFLRAGDGDLLKILRPDLSAMQVRLAETTFRKLRWLVDARSKGFEPEPFGPGWSAGLDVDWPAIALPRGRVMLDLGWTEPRLGPLVDPSNAFRPGSYVLSVEKVNTPGRHVFGYLYPHKTVRMWIAGMAYRTGWG